MQKVFILSIFAFTSVLTGCFDSSSSSSSSSSSRVPYIFHAIESRSLFGGMGSSEGLSGFGWEETTFYYGTGGDERSTYFEIPGDIAKEFVNKTGYLINKGYNTITVCTQATGGICYESRSEETIQRFIDSLSMNTKKE